MTSKDPDQTARRPSEEGLLRLDAQVREALDRLSQVPEEQRRRTLSDRFSGAVGIGPDGELDVREPSPD